MHIGDNMRLAIERRGLTQIEVAERMGVDRLTLLYYLKQPTAPKRNRLEDFCRAVGCDIEEIIKEKDLYEKIPIYGNIAAGIPIEAIEDITGYEEVSRDVYRNTKEYFALRIKGYSMYPRMRTGDVVIFHKQPTADNEDIVAVFVGNEDATCKQFIQTEGGIILHSYNDAFGDMRFTTEQVKQFPITIIGKAVELRSRL